MGKYCPSHDQVTVMRERERERERRGVVVVEFTTERPEEGEAGYQGNWGARNEKMGLHHSRRKLLLAKQHRTVAIETKRTGIL